MNHQIVAACVPHFWAEMYRQRGQLPATTAILIANSRNVIACCSLAAARGVTPKATLRQAQTLIPGAVVLRPDAALEADALNGLLHRLAEVTPLLEYRSGDHPNRSYPAQAGVFYFDLENTRRADAVKIARHIHRLLSNEFKQSIGVGLALNKFAAYAASSAGLEVQVIDDPAAFLAPLPIELLPLDEEWERRLRLLGLRTLGQFAVLPHAAVYRQFGKHGLFLRQLAAGFDVRRVEPFTPQIVEQVRHESDHTIGQQAVLEIVLASLASELSTRLQKRGCMGRTLHLAFTFEDGARRERHLTMQREVSGAAFIEKALRLLTDGMEPLRMGVTCIEVTLTDVVPFAGYQLDLFDHRGEQWTRLTQAVEKLAARYGREAFTRPVEIDRHARVVERRYQFQPFLTS